MAANILAENGRAIKVNVLVSRHWKLRKAPGFRTDELFFGFESPGSRYSMNCSAASRA